VLVACQFDCRHKSHLPNHSNNIHTITIPLFVLFCFVSSFHFILCFVSFALLCLAWLLHGVFAAMVRHSGVQAVVWCRWTHRGCALAVEEGAIMKKNRFGVILFEIGE